MPTPSRRTTPKKSAPLDFDALLAEATPRESTARVLLRQDLVNRHADLKAELAAALASDEKLNESPKGPAIAQQIIDLEAEMDVAGRDFVFRSMGRLRWADLLAQFGPTKEQRRLGHEMDPDTFPYEAIAASCVDPVMTVAQVRQLADAINQSQWAILWQACLNANVGLDSPKDPAAGLILRMSAPSVSIAANGESPAASS